MPRTRIKFCGMTRIEDAQAAVELGAWALGVILWPGSARACDPVDAARIAQAYRRRVELVGVVVNQPLDEVAYLAETIPLSMVQLHGDEGPSYATELQRRTGVKVIKAARVRGGSDVQALDAFRDVDFHLFDAHVEGVPGGTGETFEWQLARRRVSQVPLITAGGLTSDNVADAIAATRPFAVDVAGGVESAPGIKDHEKLRAFAEAVQATDTEVVA